MLKTHFAPRAGLVAAAWLTGLLLLPTLAQAGIVREAVLDNESYGYSVPPPPIDGPGTSYARIETTAAPSLNTDFSTLGETAVTFTFAAPVGMRFHVSFAEAGSLSAKYEGGGRAVSAGSIRPISTITFTGLGGDPIGTPSSPSMSFSGPGGDYYAATADWSMDAGTDFWFKSLSMTALIPAAYDADLSGGSVPKASLTGYINPSEADFGQFVWLEPIPTSGAVPLPASWLLLGLGGLLLMYRGRQRD